LPSIILEEIIENSKKNLTGSTFTTDEAALVLFIMQNTLLTEEKEDCFL
jgi:hypothetical protein